MKYHIKKYLDEIVEACDTPKYPHQRLADLYGVDFGEIDPNMIFQRQAFPKYKDSGLLDYFSYANTVKPN